MEKYESNDDVFDLNKIPMSVLDKWWKDYRPYTLCFSHTHPLSTPYIVESTDCLKQIERVKSIMTSSFELDNEQIVIKDGHNSLYAVILIPERDKNTNIIERYMEKMRFFRCHPSDDKLLVDDKMRTWRITRFEPTRQDDVTEEVHRRFKHLYYLIPSALEQNVETNGIRLSNGGDDAQCPESRAYMIRGDATENDIRMLAIQMFKQEKDKQMPNLSPNYTLFKIDLSKIDNAVRFFYDKNGPTVIFTTMAIAPESFVDKSHIMASDIDQTLQKYKLETCIEIAVKLITSLSDYGVHVYQNKRRFGEVKQEIQTVLDERAKKIDFSGIHINIMDIELDSRIGKSTLWEWAKRMDKIKKKDKYIEFMISFENEFYKTFSETIFCE